MAALRDETELAQGSNQREQTAVRRQFAVTLLCDVVLPVGLYYVLRGAGFSELESLLMSAATPALNTGYSIVRQRKVDSIGLFVIAILALAGIGSLISGSPRMALARGGWFTGLIALGILGSLFTSRPFTYRAVKTLLPGKSETLEGLWCADPQFRRIWRGLTVLWGCGLLVDAALRVIMAYTLSVDTVPALDGALYFVTYIALQVTTHIILYRTGVFQLLFPGRGRQPGRFRPSAGTKDEGTA
ncbi:VC0807 family protein [Streptomyces sp. NPDC048612]|uniref:VC0807 family protein n=1 Tax=Streptomyces sp. NPDC048612 TaxID=3365579 RepID=UPI003718897B